MTEVGINIRDLEDSIYLRDHPLHGVYGLQLFDVVLQKMFFRCPRQRRSNFFPTRPTASIHQKFPTSSNIMKFQNHAYYNVNSRRKLRNNFLQAKSNETGLNLTIVK